LIIVNYNNYSIYYYLFIVNWLFQIIVNKLTTINFYCKLITIIKISLITLIKTKFAVIKIPLFKSTNKCSLCWFEWHNGSILQLFSQICWNQQINVHSVDSSNINLLISELFSQICWNQQKIVDYVLIRTAFSCSDFNI